MQITVADSDLKELISLEEFELHPDILKCLRYLLLKESNPPLNMDQITAALHSEYSDIPTTRVGLYYRLEVWRKNGTMRSAEEIFLVPKIEEMRAVISEAITSYPNIVRRLIFSASTTANARDTLEILKYLKDLMQPEIDKVEQVSDKEITYAKSSKNFNPMAFVNKMQNSNPPDESNSS